METITVTGNKGFKINIKPKITKYLPIADSKETNCMNEGYDIKSIDEAFYKYESW